MNDPSEEKTTDGFGEIGKHFLVVRLKDSFVFNVEDDYWILPDTELPACILVCT